MVPGIRLSRGGQFVGKSGISLFRSLALEFGEAIRDATAPDTTPVDIGGDADTIWFLNAPSNGDTIYELDPSDFSSVRTGVPPSSLSAGVGGDTDTIWYNDLDDIVYELSTTDFSVVNSGAAPSVASQSSGGDTNALYHSDTFELELYELDTGDFSVIRSVGAPGGNAEGIGGGVDIMYHTNRQSGLDQNYKHTVTDLSIIAQADHPIDSGEVGIGGSIDVVWWSTDEPDMVWELATGG